MLLVCASLLQAQYGKLDSLSTENLKVYFSSGQQQRAKQVSKMAHQAIEWANGLVHFKPEVKLLILSPADWPQYTKFPVYGMPHYADKKTLVVAAEDNDYWKSFIPPLNQLPPALANQIKTVYRVNGSLSMQPFFDLLALHELGHAFHNQGGLTMQRKWMGELFCNIFLHTYIAENEPALLPALTVFPNMVVAAGTAGYSFTTLQQFESNYEELGMRQPRNYGWYQCRLHAAAREIYDAGGKEVFAKLWHALQNSSAMDDAQLTSWLSKEVHPAVADVLLKW